MTTQDLVPPTTLAPGAGLNLPVATADFDWVAVFVNPNGAAATWTIYAATDQGSGFPLWANNVAAGGTEFACFGGAGGVVAGASVKAAVPFVPAQILLSLAAAPGAAWTFAVIGGWLS